MQFEADLDLAVDGTSAHVRGDRETLIIESADPRALIGALRQIAGAPTRPQLTAVANGLAACGASVHVDGPRGRFVTLGADADSRAFGLLTGTRHLVPAWPALLSSSLGVARRRRIVVAVTAAVAISATIILPRRSTA